MMVEKFIQSLRAAGKTRLSFEETYGIFKATMPDRYASEDNGMTHFLELLHELKGQGILHYPENKRNKKPYARYLVPIEIQIKRDKKPKAERELRHWDPRILSETHKATDSRLGFLSKLDDFLKSKQGRLPLAPIKARSLQIFGDEKLLENRMTDKKSNMVLRDLPLEDLDCYRPQEMFLVSTSYDKTAAKILIVENSEIYHVMKLRNDSTREFKAIVYGAGNYFKQHAPFLETFLAPGQDVEFMYFGDIDVPGFEIPRNAQATLDAAQIPICLTPDTKLYKECLLKGKAAKTLYRDKYDWVRGDACKTRDWTRTWFLKYSDGFETLDAIIKDGNRIAQEWIGLP